MNQNKSFATSVIALIVLVAYNINFAPFGTVFAAPNRMRTKVSRKSFRTLAFLHSSKFNKVPTHSSAIAHSSTSKYQLNSCHPFASDVSLNNRLNTLEPLHWGSSHTSIASRLFSTSSSTDSRQDINMKHFEVLESTQDEARKILHDPSLHEPNTFLAITTTSQTKGRGTNKRKWIGRKGNTFLTIAVPSNELKIPLTLLPLQIGNILAKQVKLMLKKTNAVVTLKWPNDVLVDQKKIAGVLIESDKDHAGNYYFLIGIGVNYRFAPLVETSGKERGRITTCIYDYVNGDDDDDNDKCGVESAKALGKRIAGDVRDWVKMQKNWDGAADSVVAMWDTWAEYGNKLILRDEPGNQSVTPLGLERDGRLRVKGQDGKERLLSSDYLL